MKKNIRTTAYTATFSAIISTLIVTGGLLDILDMTCVAVCSFVVYMSFMEFGTKYALMVFISSSVLSFIVMPSLSTAYLYYVMFFGYYPLIRPFIKKAGKILSRIISCILFCVIMTFALLCFKAVFGMANEPTSAYAVFIIALVIFFLAFDYSLDFFIIIYVKKLKKIFKI